MLFELKAQLNLCEPNNLIDDKKYQQLSKRLRRGNQFRILDLSREGARFHVVGLHKGYA
jgi:hypothetical protein